MSQRSESAWCSRCRAVTAWSGKDQRLRCAGCGTDFPCARQCGHWDCLEVKGLAAPDEQGILRLTGACASQKVDADPLEPSVVLEPAQLELTAAGEAGTEVADCAI
jgi:hypothetical protein